MHGGVDTVTSSDVSFGDVTHGGVTPVNVIPSQVSINGYDKELRACKICNAEQPSRGNVECVVKLTCDVKVT